MRIISKIMPNITHLFGILLNFVPTLSLQVENSHKPCGWGHHKRRKKNARGRFDRRKNDERRRQQANKENISVLPPPKSTDIIPDSSLLLPKAQPYPVLQIGRGLQWTGWSNCICYPRLISYVECICWCQEGSLYMWHPCKISILLIDWWQTFKAMTMQFYAQAIQMRNLSQHARIKEDVWEERGEMEMWLHSLTNLQSLITVGSNPNA